MKLKPVKMWCVYGPHGTEAYCMTIRYTRAESIDAMGRFYIRDYWHNYLRLGYRCLRVTVTPLLKKGKK